MSRYLVKEVIGCLAPGCRAFHEEYGKDFEDTAAAHELKGWTRAEAKGRWWCPEHRQEKPDEA